MQIQLKKLTLMSAFIAGSININDVQAREDIGSLNYDNRAYVHAIHNAPNPVSDVKVQSAKIAYADKAYGQAIYSYPSTVVFQESEFNVEYVDTAYGQAIYSYPNNNLVTHHLELSSIKQSPADTSTVPVVFKSKVSGSIVSP